MPIVKNDFSCLNEFLVIDVIHWYNSEALSLGARYDGNIWVITKEISKDNLLELLKIAYVKKFFAVKEDKLKQHHISENDLDKLVSMEELKKSTVAKNPFTFGNFGYSPITCEKYIYENRLWIAERYLLYSDGEILNLPFDFTKTSFPFDFAKEKEVLQQAWFDYGRYYLPDRKKPEYPKQAIYEKN